MEIVTDWIRIIDLEAFVVVREAVQQYLNIVSKGGGLVNEICPNPQYQYDFVGTARKRQSTHIL